MKLMPSFLIYIICSVTILSAISLKLIREKKKETKSLYDFTVMCPRGYRLFFASAAWVTMFLFLFITLYDKFINHSYNSGLLLFGALMTSLFALLFLIFTIWKLEVKQDILTYTSLTGIKRRTVFAHIERIRITSQGSIIIYDGNKRFGIVDQDFMCAKNFLKRLKAEKIECQPQAQLPITKLRLYLKAMKPLFIISIMVGISLFMIMIYENALSLDFLILILSAVFFLIAICSLLPLCGLLRICRQERRLHFSFAEEMASSYAAGSYFQNFEWFIDIDLAHVVAFHRNFINEIKIIKNEGAGQEKEVVVVTIDGHKIKVKSSISSLRAFKDWFERKAAADDKK